MSNGMAGVEGVTMICGPAAPAAGPAKWTRGGDAPAPPRARDEEDDAPLENKEEKGIIFRWAAAALRRGRVVGS